MQRIIENSILTQVSIFVLFIVINLLFISISYLYAEDNNDSSLTIEKLKDLEKLWVFEVEDDVRGAIVKISGEVNEETNKVEVTTTWENDFFKKKIGYGKEPSTNSKTYDNIGSGYIKAEKKASDIKNKVENFYNFVKGGEVPVVSVKVSGVLTIDESVVCDKSSIYEIEKYFLTIINDLGN